jgi:hypothetical protein
MRQKRRVLPTPLGVSKNRIRIVEGGKEVQNFLHSFTYEPILGSQVTDSENHSWPPSQGQGDVGGDFFTTKKWATVNPAVVSGYYRTSMTQSYSEYQFSGPMYDLYPPYKGYFPSMSNTSTSDLNQAGAKAVALCMPTNSLVNLGTFLGELIKDGLPRAGAQSWKDGTIRARKAGDDYLNAQFGWMPIARDINRVALAIDQAERVVAQFERDAGRSVRRRFRFPRILTNTELYSDTFYQSPLVGIYGEMQRAFDVGERRMQVSQQFS